MVMEAKIQDLKMMKCRQRNSFFNSVVNNSNPTVTTMHNFKTPEST